MKKSKNIFFFIVFLLSSFFASVGIVIGANVNNSALNNSFKIPFNKEEQEISNQIKALETKPIDNDKLINTIDERVRLLILNRNDYDTTSQYYKSYQSDINAFEASKSQINNDIANNKLIALELQSQLDLTIKAHQLAYEKSLQTFNIVMSILIIVFGSIFIFNYGYTIILFFKENTFKLNFIKVSKRK